MVLSRSGSPPAPQPYHHGNLRQALVDAALALAQQKGPERVSVREAARLLGVSPAAPFRHFPNRRALMTAVAEEAGTRLRIEVQKAVAAERRDGVYRLHAIGRGYLQWVQAHPAHFRIVSARDQIDAEQSVSLQAGTAELQQLIRQTLQQAQSRGDIRSDLDTERLLLLLRASLYGLARMQIDGHLPQWQFREEAEAATLQGGLDMVLKLLKPPA
jgi:AcrR family transcriptional regulator